MELRGTIADYAQTAARAMTDDGWFVYCFAAGDPRAEEAAPSAGLHVVARCDVVFRTGQPPTIQLFAARKHPEPCVQWPAIVVRDPDGQWTDTYVGLRAFMGFDTPGR